MPELGCVVSGIQAAQWQAFALEFRAGPEFRRTRAERQTLGRDRQARMHLQTAGLAQFGTAMQIAPHRRQSKRADQFGARRRL